MNSHKPKSFSILNLVIGVLLLSGSLGAMGIFAQTPGLPILTRVIVKAAVTLQPSGVYEYQYTVQNLTETQAELWSLDIDITYPTSSQVLSEEGLTNGPGYAAETSRVGPLLFPDTPKMLPVGVWSPEDWVSGLGQSGTAGWGSGDHSKIKPGASEDGFMIISHGLPGIRAIKSRPWIDVAALYSSPETLSELDELTKQMDKDKEIASFKGQTIGPTAPPANFLALDFVNYIIDLKHQAGTFGWITNPGVQDSLDVKLDQVKKKLQTGDTKTATNMLNAFLNEVDAQGCLKYDDCPAGKHLLPEAWALLKFNGQYLIGKL